MPKNLQALYKHILLSIVLYAFIGGGSFLPAQEDLFFAEGSGSGIESETRWYRSNSAGMALELVTSRSAALRNEYCLSVQGALSFDLPPILISHYEHQFSIELRILYENGSEIRRQWIFRDAGGIVRLTSSGSSELYSGTYTEDFIDRDNTDDDFQDNDSQDEDSKDDDSRENISGFIEIRDSGGALTREYRFEEDRSAWDFRYFYREMILLSTETWFRLLPSDSDFTLVSTDYYRYSRTGSLRAIDRTLHEGAESKTRIGFPAIGIRVPTDEGFIVHGIAYTSQFLQNIYSPEGTKIQYTFDSRGRITREIWRDSDDTIIGEFRNTWDGDRLGTVLWKSKDDERLVEYEYDSAGNRTLERNFKKGVLERIVRGLDDREMEEIYMNGNLVLRAIWVKGLKISEEWVLPGGRSR